MSWKPDEIDFLKKNLNKLTFAQIAKALGKSELAVHLYVHRNRIPVREQQGRNLVVEILTIKFVNPEYFMPTKSFYRAVKIGQKRWWDLYYGKAKLTDDEYIRLARHFQISLEDAFNARQLKLFDNKTK